MRQNAQSANLRHWTPSSVQSRAKWPAPGIFAKRREPRRDFFGAWPRNPRSMQLGQHQFLAHWMMVKFLKHKKMLEKTHSEELKKGNPSLWKSLRLCLGWHRRPGRPCGSCSTCPGVRAHGPCPCPPCRAPCCPCPGSRRRNPMICLYQQILYEMCCTNALIIYNQLCDPLR